MSKYYNEYHRSSHKPTFFSVPGQLVLIGLLIGAIFANIIQFPAIERSIDSVYYTALNNYPTHDLAEIGRKYTGPNARVRFGPYLGLSQLTPGVNIIVPADSTFSNEMLYGLGLAESVDRLNYNAENILPDFELYDFETTDLGGSEKRAPGKVTLILGNEEPEALIVIWRVDTWYLVDLNLINNTILEELAQ